MQKQRKPNRTQGKLQDQFGSVQFLVLSSDEEKRAHTQSQFTFCLCFICISFFSFGSQPTAYFMSPVCTTLIFYSFKLNTHSHSCNFIFLFARKKLVKIIWVCVFSVFLWHNTSRSAGLYIIFLDIMTSCKIKKYSSTCLTHRVA